MTIPLHCNNCGGLTNRPYQYSGVLLCLNCYNLATQQQLRDAAVQYQTEKLIEYVDQLEQNEKSFSPPPAVVAVNSELPEDDFVLPRPQLSPSPPQPIVYGTAIPISASSSLSVSAPQELLTAVASSKTKVRVLAWSMSLMVVGILVTLLVLWLTRKPSREEVLSRARQAVVVIEGSRASGSGFFIRPDVIVTNHHVIDGQWNYRIYDQTGRNITFVKTLADDARADLTIIRVNTTDHSYLRISQQQPEIGSIVYAVGNPEGMSWTCSAGNVSAFRDQLIQFTAPISPGSSGGPLLNENGDVVGIVNMYNRTGQNINFAIPSGWINLLWSP